MANKKNLVVQANRPKQEMHWQKRIRELEEENAELLDRSVREENARILSGESVNLQDLMRNQLKADLLAPPLFSGAGKRTVLPPEAICCAIGQAMRFIRRGQGLYTRPNALVDGYMWTAFADNVKRGVRLEVRRNRNDSGVKKYFIKAESLLDLSVEAEEL